MARRERRVREQWEKIIDEQAQSGLPAKAYCKRESIGLASFYQWRRRLSDGASPLDGGMQEKSSFIDIGRLGEARGEAPVVGSGFELTLELGGGLNLVLRRG